MRHGGIRRNISASAPVKGAHLRTIIASRLTALMDMSEKACMADRGTWLKDGAAATASPPAASDALKK